MSRSQNWSAFQVGCAYIGTVVGAGFASGQEIYQFFGKYGTAAFFTIVISMVLFAVIGYRLMELGRRLKAKSYRELNAYLFGPVIGKIVNIVLLVMLFGITVAMLAGSGELFRERLGLSFQFGVAVTVIFTFWTILGGMNGLLRANTLIVPIMVGFVLLAGVHTAFDSRNVAFVHHATLSPHVAISSVISSIVYAAFNSGLSAGVLVPLGNEMNDPHILKRGAWIGAIGLGTMLIVILYTLLCYSPEALSYQLPMAFIASQIGSVVQWVFILVLWGEIYSTLVGNVFSIMVQFPHRDLLGKAIVATVILAIAFALSHIGFSKIVGIAYPTFGWVSLLILTALILPNRKLLDS